MVGKSAQRKMLKSTWLMTKDEKGGYLRYAVVRDEKKHEVR
jgi:hypothetical protein